MYVTRREPIEHSFEASLSCSGAFVSPRPLPWQHEMLTRPLAAPTIMAPKRWPSGQAVDGPPPEASAQQQKQRSRNEMAAVLRLEEQVRRSVSAKTDNLTSESRFLRKAFAKYGTKRGDRVTLEEFCTVLECFGFGGVDPAIAAMLFRRYDFEGNGTVSSDDFAASLFTTPGALVPRPLEPGALWYR